MTETLYISMFATSPVSKSFNLEFGFTFFGNPLGIRLISCVLDCLLVSQAWTLWSSTCCSGHPTFLDDGICIQQKMLTDAPLISCNMTCEYLKWYLDVRRKWLCDWCSEWIQIDLVPRKLWKHLMEDKQVKNVQKMARRNWRGLWWRFWWTCF